MGVVTACAHATDPVTAPTVAGGRTDATASVAPDPENPAPAVVVATTPDQPVVEVPAPTAPPPSPSGAVAEPQTATTTDAPSSVEAGPPPTKVLAPEIGDAAGAVTGRLSLHPSPATDYAVLFGPGLEPRHRDDVEATLSVLMHLFPASRMSGVEVFVSTDEQWLDQQVSSSGRIGLNEQQKFLTSLRDGTLGESVTYSLRGPSHEQTVVVFANDWDLEGTRIAQGVARELSINFFSVEGTGVEADPWPCWAAEGLGYPIGWEAVARATGTTYQQVRDPWVSQLWRTDGVRLGLEASELRAGTREHPCFLNPGVGHIQGALFAEMLLAERGLDGMLAWAAASRNASWREGFLAVYGSPVEEWYARFDRAVVAALR